jgi:uncharacterized membrane protein YdjX (TVP38/TMEM64 family)
MTDTMVSAAANRRRTTWIPLLLRVGLLLTLLGLLAIGAQLLGPWSPARLKGLLAAAGPFAPAVFVALFVVLNSVGVPAPLLGATGGLTLGLIPGALATLAGMTAAACVQLLLARHLTGRSWTAVRLPGTDRLPTILQGHGWLAVVALRLTPGPFSEVNLAAGLTTLHVRSMAVGTLVGGAPKALGWAALGLGAIHLPAAPALVIAAAVVAGLALTGAWLRQRGQPPAAAQPDPAPPHETSPTSDPPALQRVADNRG